MAFYVYILKCADGSYYTGHTDDIEARMHLHITGASKACYTATRLPVNLVFQQEFVTREEALIVEQQIKGWSRAKKEAMMRSDWAELVRLAKTRHHEQADADSPSAARPCFDKLSTNGVENGKSPA